MKKVWIVSLIAGLGLLAACSKPVNDDDTGNFIRLHECKPLPGSNDMRLCFESVLTDSRCPSDVVCIWQGTAVARFSIEKNDARIHELTLSTNGVAPYRRDTTVAGYKIEFINLHPYPQTNRTSPVPDNEIKAEVKITKL